MKEINAAYDQIQNPSAYQQQQAYNNYYNNQNTNSYNSYGQQYYDFDDLFKRASQNGGFYYRNVNVTPKRYSLLRVIITIIIISFIFNNCGFLPLLLFF